MEKAGSIAGQILARLGDHLAPGVSTQRLDDLAAQMMADSGVLSSFKGFRGYPSTICTSINDVVVHGIPSPDLRLEEGDIISIDLGVIYLGYHADTASTFSIGRISKEAEHLVTVTREARAVGIARAVAGRPLSDVSRAVQAHVEEVNGCSVIRALTGHGIGKTMHEDPPIPNFDDGDAGPILKRGMALAIEPMVSLGDHRVTVDADGWTVRTADGSLAAHFEHTIVVERDGPRILTMPPDRAELGEQVDAERTSVAC